MSQKKLYVGNLPYQTKEEDLRELFSAHGAVEEIRVITDRETGRSKGFGFVTFAAASEAEAAVSALNGHNIGGRDLRVNIAHDKASGGGRNERSAFAR